MLTPTEDKSRSLLRSLTYKSLVPCPDQFNTTSDAHTAVDVGVYVNVFVRQSVSPAIFSNVGEITFCLVSS